MKPGERSETVFSFGGSEFLIIVVLAVLLFGPDKIPQLARTIGRFTREFNKYKSIMESTLSAEIYRAEGPTQDTMTIEQRIAKAGAASGALTERREAAIAEAAEASPEGEKVTLAEDAPVDESSANVPAAAAGHFRSATPSAYEADEEDEE